MTGVWAGVVTAGLVLGSGAVVRRLLAAARGARAVAAATGPGPRRSALRDRAPVSPVLVPGPVAFAAGSGPGGARPAARPGSTRPPRGPWVALARTAGRALDALQVLLQSADVPVEAATAVRRWLLAAVVALVLMGGRWGTGGVVVAVALSVGVPAGVLAWRRGREAQRVEAALPGLLEGLAGRLRAGASLSEALVEAAEGRTGSTSLDADLRDLSLRVRHGQPFASTVETWARHRDVPGVGLVAAALVMGSEAGGARAHALDGVAATLRDRRSLAAEVDALSSQARASAVVMMGAPVVFAALGLLGDPAVSAFLLRTPAGLACLVGGLALDATAGLWMMRIAGRAG